VNTDARYFESRAAFRAWLAANHDSPDELWVGFHKKASGRPSITYREALDEALCFGWIDGLRQAVDGDRFRQRFTKRRPGSAWSAANVRRMEALIAEGRAAAPGLAAFEARNSEAPPVSRESLHAAFSAEYEALLRQQTKAWEFLQAQPPGYRRLAASFVMNAKREETRIRRLQILIEESERGVRLDPMKPQRAAAQVPERSATEGVSPHRADSSAS
jgi:uncharacterized protein YdeI (YjbR/CyaY-like superfamily)